MMARWVHHDAAAMLLLVKGRSKRPALLVASILVVWHMIQHYSGSVERQVLQSASLVRRQQVALVAIVTTDPVITG